MDIEQAKSAKGELEKSIAQALENFQRSTGLTVACIFLKRIDDPDKIGVEISARL